MDGKRLQQLRNNKGLNADELGKFLNLSGSSIRSYESGYRNPDVEGLETIANFFNVSTDYLLGRNDNSSDQKFVPANIILIKGKMDYNELVEDIARKLNDPCYKKTFTSRRLKEYVSGKTIPKYPEITALSLYADVDRNFFYKNNTVESYEIEKQRYLIQKEMKVGNKIININVTNMDLDIEKVKELFNPDNAKYIKYAIELKEKNIDPDNIIGYQYKR